MQLTERWPFLHLTLPLLLTAAMLSYDAHASPGYPISILNSFSAEPEPFRRDEIDGRDFEYNNESFLHRYSYRLRTDWQKTWDDNREGIALTAGSTRTDELFEMHLFRKTIPFNETIFGVMRHQRQEDFDTRYDRFLTGLGAKFGEGWSLSLLGDIVATKQDIDPQLELAWRNSEGSRFRGAFVATDSLK